MEREVEKKENAIMKIDGKMEALKKMLDELLREVLLTNQYFLESVPKVGECNEQLSVGKKSDNFGWFANHYNKLELLTEQIAGIRGQIRKLGILTNQK